MPYNYSGKRTFLLNVEHLRKNHAIKATPKVIFTSAMKRTHTHSHCYLGANNAMQKCTDIYLFIR